MNIQVRELMTGVDVTVAPSATVEQVRTVMARENLGALPVLDTELRPVGMVTATDFTPVLHPKTPIREIMMDRVFTIPLSEDISSAARVMRDNRTFRLLVTEQEKVVGMLNAFDLLKVVESPSVPR